MKNLWKEKDKEDMLTSEAFLEKLSDIHSFTFERIERIEGIERIRLLNKRLSLAGLSVLLVFGKVHCESFNANSKDLR